MTTSKPVASERGPDRSRPARPRPNWTVFCGSATVIVALTVWAVAAPSHAEEVLGVMVGWTTDWFGWFYVLLATTILVFVAVIALSRYGNVKLGPEHSEPEFSTFAWASMLFAAGIGTDLMFFAVAEPVTQYLHPPSESTPPESVEAAREATVWTLFHYGISGWAMYALMGMALGYFAYRMNLPLAVRSALRPVFGSKVEGRGGDIIDVAAVLGTVFGVATTLGIAVVQLNYGLDRLFGVPQGIAVQVGLIVLGVAMATLSAVSGVDRGIKWLSQLNVLAAIALAVFVLFAGPTTHLLNALVLNIGDFARLFPDMTMQTFAFEDTGDWMSLWTLFFWAWWIAWASFVGLFLARISRGRTIRQFVMGTLLIPFSYILMWISIFGNAAIDQIRGGNAEFGSLAVDYPERGFYSLLFEYPGFTAVASLATFVALLFYVTSADSGALVIANLSSRLPDVYTDSASWMRVFWACVTGALTVALLAVGGVTTLQYATIVMGLPFAFVMVFVMIGLYRALRLEGFRADSASGGLPGALSGRSAVGTGVPGRSWRQRVGRTIAFPSARAAQEYCTGTVVPALEEVAAELHRQGYDASTSVVEVTDTDADAGADAMACPELVVVLADGHPFRYRVCRRLVPVPVYGGHMPEARDTYARLEVHLHLGGQGYDVMGYTHGQLIDDVLDRFEQHLEFLRLSHVAD